MEPDIVSELKPIRLPVGFDAFDFAGMLAIFSIAVLLGLGLAALVRALSEPKPSTKRLAVQSLAEAKALPIGERLMVQRKVLGAVETETLDRHRRSRKSRPAVSTEIESLKTRIGSALYRPEPSLDCDAIDRDLIGLVSKLKA